MGTDNMFDMAERELDLVQRQMDKYDEIGSKVKTWAVTLWVTLFGWSLQFDNPSLLLLGLAAVTIFFALDAVNKNFRQDYKERRGRVADALRSYVRSGTWPDGFTTPVMPEHPPTGILRQMREPHIYLLYLPLAVISLAAYLLRA